MSMFEVNKVVGSGNAQEFLCQTINLGANISEIKEIRKTVIIDNCKVVFDKVIIDGRLRKDIIAVCASQGLPIPGTVRGCTGIVAQVNGSLNDVTVEFAFNALIPVEGAKPGDQCVVLQAFVEGEKEEAANIDRETGTFTALVDKTIVFLCVKVVRDALTGDCDDDHDDSWGTSGGVSGGKSDGCSGEHEGHEHKEHRKRHGKGCGKGSAEVLCPKPRSTGHFQGSDRIPPATPGLIPGTFVGPTLIFPGVINPGIPTLIPPLNQIGSRQGSQLQITGGESGRDN